MYLPTSLTPLSRSIFDGALLKAHQRLITTLSPNLPTTTLLGNLTPSWGNSLVAALVATTWNQPPPRIGHLLAVELPADIVAAGKAGNAARTAFRFLAESADNRRRLSSWAQGVFDMTWNQAQLLQVMEEIEPSVYEALYDCQGAAWAAGGSYAHLLTLLEKHLEVGAQAIQLDVVGGLETPDGAMISDLAIDLEEKEWLRRYGYRGDNELELASPRLTEFRPPLHAPPTAIEGSWNPTAAAQRREEAMQVAISAAGFLQRSSMRKAIELCQTALTAHAEARDTLAMVSAAARRWSLAAAREGLEDGRLKSPDEIFQLELEEIKQMMTGEWHSREQIQPILKQRQQPTQNAASSVTETCSKTLGVAGQATSGFVCRLDGPAPGPVLPTHTIAVVIKTTPAWAPLFLQIDGVISQQGDLLSHTASVGRCGGLSTLVAVPDKQIPEDNREIRIDPAANRIELAN